MAAKPERRKCTDDDCGCGGGAEKGEEDDGLLALSLGLGDIYRRSAAEAGADVEGDGGFRSPVTPTMPIPLRPAGARGARHFAAATTAAVRPPSPAAATDAAVDPPPPPRFDAPGVVQGCNDSCSFLIPAAASVLTPTHQMAVVLTIDGNGVVPAAVHGIAPPALPPPAHLKTAVPPPPLTTPPAASKETAGVPPSAKPRPRRAKRSRGAGRPKPGDDNGVAPTATEGGGGLLLSPPYPWATDRACVHRSLAELGRLGIDAVTGELECKRCDSLETVTLDVQAKFKDLCGYISRNIQVMNDRAPKRWQEPSLPDCGRCGQRSSMRPVIPADKERKHRINWVFLLLGEMLGLLTLEHLKYFCAHTHQHRTGAKDRVLYSTYMELCNQLLPGGIFDMESQRQQKRVRLINA